MQFPSAKRVYFLTVFAFLLRILHTEFNVKIRSLPIADSLWTLFQEDSYPRVHAREMHTSQGSAQTSICSITQINFVTKENFMNFL